MTALVNICGLVGVSREMVRDVREVMSSHWPNTQHKALSLASIVHTLTILMKVQLWAEKIVDNNTRDDSSNDSGDAGVTKEEFIQNALQLEIINACLKSSKRDLGFSH